MPSDNPQMLGRYQLLALLATGGMAEIYLARQTGIGGFQKLVVVKKILSHLARDERFVEMFFDEARIAAQLNHPNIVQIYDLGKAEEDYFIAMEYLEGESLGFLVKESYDSRKPMSSAMAAGIIAQVCDGLDYAHKFTDEMGRPLNIVHRDVSPHNIITMFNGVVKLVDFGIAKAASQMHQTRIGTLKGKLTYMSPEQCRGKPVDGRSDIFALGVVFWELLTRRRLFKRESEPEVITAIIVDEIPHVHTVKKNIPAELAKIAMRALEKNAGNRYQTAHEMGADLREYLRASGQAAGTHETSDYVKNVFQDRARTKQKLLEEIESRGADGVSLGALKPATSESVPSASQAALTGAQEQGGDLHHAATRIRSPDEEVALDPGATRILPSDDREPEPTPEPAPRQSETKLRVAEEPLEPEELRAARSRSSSVLTYVVLPFLLGCGVVALALWWYSSQNTADDGAGGLQPVPMNPRVADAGIGAGPVSPPDAGQEAPLADAGAGSQRADRDAIARPPEGADAGSPSPPAADRARVAAAPKPAELSVSSEPPGCQVEVDGSRVSGLTPVDGLSVAAGKRHAVTVLCQGHRKQVKRVRGKSGERIALSFKPRKLGKRPDRPPKPPKPPKPQKAQTGFLKLKTKPWSEVYLGRKKLGMTPLIGVELPAGKHVLTAINKPRGLSKKIQVVILPGKTTTVKRDLEE
ncbi:MAG: serine/threonine protein kinase [Deltaproteobacteria bacterium]|nr:serine/threonine protein kinase [Deltaproteobacteria bacterium]